MGILRSRLGSCLSILTAVLVAMVIVQSTPGASAGEPSSKSRTAVQALPATSPTTSPATSPQQSPTPANPGDGSSESPNDNPNPSTPAPSTPDQQQPTIQLPPAQIPTAAEVASVMKVQKKYNSTLLKIKGVVGVATGLGYTGGVVIQVYVKKKGDVGPIPTQLKGVTVDVHKTSGFRTLQRAEQPRIRVPTGQAEPDNPTEFFPRPVPIGISIGPEYWDANGGYWAGTLGARVKDNAGNVYILSNNHVLAGVNVVPLGTAILQPGLYDTNGVVPGPNYRIGQLTRYITIRLNDASYPPPKGIGPNLVDCAIAKTTTSQVSNVTPHDGYRAYHSVPVAATLGQRVQKCGRTTGYVADHYVIGLNWMGLVGMNADTGDVAMFDGQIVIAAGDPLFSDHGDSGSLIVTDADVRRRGRPFDRRIRPEESLPVPASDPVGLLFAGSDTETLANPIQRVLTALNVKLDGE